MKSKDKNRELCGSLIEVGKTNNSPLMITGNGRGVIKCKKIKGHNGYHESYGIDDGNDVMILWASQKKDKR